ncbi:hypothetical protein ACYCVF_35420 [Bradyrhizobium sp. 1.29L]
MAQSDFKTCFISAPFGTDTAPLRAALEQRNVQWRDQTNIALGTSWIELLEDEMSRADFICSVIPEDANPNVMFELGLAIGRNKPVLALVKSAAGLPLDALTYFVLPPDAEALGRALDTFLSHSKPISKRPRKAVVPKSSPGVANKAPTTRIGHTAELQAAELLRQAGYIVSDEMGPMDKGVDLAVWIDELEPVIGGPLLVQVKSGQPSMNRVLQAKEELREYVIKTNGKVGLIVWWGVSAVPEPPSPPGRHRWPLIVVLPGEKLTRLVESGGLTSELTRLRNAAVHGGV